MSKRKWWRWRNQNDNSSDRYSNSRNAQVHTNEEEKDPRKPKTNYGKRTNDRRKRRPEWSRGQIGQNECRNKTNTKTYASHDSACESNVNVKRSQQDRSQGSSSASAVVATSSSSSTSIGREIAGFYFDDVKKRYFRLLPGHNNHNPLSNDILQRNEAEKIRLKVLTSGTADTDSKMPQPRISSSVCQILHQRRRGEIPCMSYSRQCHGACVASMSIKSKQILSCPDTYHHGMDRESGSISLLQADKNRSKVLSVISDDHMIRLWRGNVTNRGKAFGIEDWNMIYCVGSQCGKVTSASWVSVDNQDDVHILYSISGGKFSHVELLMDSHHPLYHQVDAEMIWTCSWSDNAMLANHISVGGSKSYVVDLLTSVKTKLNIGSDVFCQVFAKLDPLLYNGTKRGEILSCDLRTPSQPGRKFASILNHGHSICCLELLQDENYLIASDMSGMIKMWDIRARSVVREFHGNHNQYRNLPFKIDSTETILYTVGQDCYTRLWNIQRGNLLKTLPPPLPASKISLPSVIYSSDWANGASPGLLLGTQKQLHWYTL